MPYAKASGPIPDIPVLVASVFLIMLSACSSPSSSPSLTEPNGDRIPIPPACEIPATGQRPYSVTFRLHNGGNASVFLHTGCFPPFQVSSCASGYADQLANLDFCPCLCDSSCPVCGACYPDGGEALAPGATKEWLWIATLLVDSGETSRGTACKRESDLPTGLYRVSIPLFATSEDGLAQTPVLRRAAADFHLPATDGAVLIETD